MMQGSQKAQEKISLPALSSSPHSLPPFLRFSPLPHWVFAEAYFVPGTALGPGTEVGAVSVPKRRESKWK